MRGEGPASAGIYPAIAGDVPAIIRQTPGVAEVDVFHAFDFRYQEQRATFGGGIMDIVRRRRALRFLSGSADEILKSLAGHDRAIVSEPFSVKHRVRVGDVLRIPLGARVVPLTVAGIYYEYSSDRGYVLVDRATLLRYLPDQPITNIAVYTAADADKTKVRYDLEFRLRGFRW